MNLKRRADATARGRERHGADHAQPVVAIPRTLHGRFAARCPSATVHRLQSEASFIDENDAGATPPGLFLMRGQSCFRHRSTAAASCSRATCWGFCGLNPKSCRIRPTWSGWYDTRNFLRTTSATRPQVHKSVRYPAWLRTVFQNRDQLVVSGPRTTSARDQDGAWRPRPPRHPPATHASNASRWKDWHRRVGQLLREASVPGNTPQRDDDELPAPPHCLWFS